MALDEATTAFLAQAAEAGGKPLHEMTPTEVRAMGAAMADVMGPGPEVGEVRDIPVDVAGGRITVRSYRPTGEPRAAVVYFHGGGWVTGALDEFDALMRQLVDRAGATVLAVDYRLAPEHPYPTAAEDAWAALRWADEHLADVGPRVPLVVAGDSAGGNLAAIVARRSVVEGGPRVALQILAYPVTDAALDTASYTDPANQLLVSRESMIWFWDHYCPPELRSNPDASPLRADDLAGLPPAVVLTAEHDPLRDEGEAYAAKLAAAGVEVEARRFDGQMHGFFTMVNLLPGAALGMDYVVEHLDRHLAKGAAAV